MKLNEFNEDNVCMYMLRHSQMNMEWTNLMCELEHTIAYKIESTLIRNTKGKRKRKKKKKKKRRKKKKKKKFY